ncbi:hypothetical protein GHT06_018997 [Daphnia sinensis]|uniref:Uncharacterized protein n=1 Tax=Daphnia sinensis TaxID=1820382 RepID=A0AAD5KKQ6_9CRUS|nr:hypothetical protein GHT06_018997 [Daphnia sinensis]
MAHSLPPTGAATVGDLDNFQNNQHIFSRLQLLPSFNGSPITRFDTWLESFESIVDGQVICSQLDFDLYDVGEKKLHTLGRVTLIYCHKRHFRRLYPWMGCNSKARISA